MLGGVIYGVAAGRWDFFPAEALRDAKHTAANLITMMKGLPEERDLGPTAIPLAAMKKARVKRLAAAAIDENFLFTGGWDEFKEFCPKDGCVAVVLDRNGGLVKAYPLFPEEFAAHEIAYAPHEWDWSAPRGISRTDEVFGVTPIKGGGLVVQFLSRVNFPYGTGVARLDANGHVLWYRRTYASHWAYATSDRILTVSGEIQDKSIHLALPRGESVDLHCGGKYVADYVRVLDLDGRVVFEFSVLDAIINSPYGSVLLQNNFNGDRSLRVCDPTHLNFVRPVGAELARSYRDVSPNDLLVSMRNISAFAIIDITTHKVKYLYTGAFRQQHAVQPFEGSKVLIFDDHGVTAGQFPSRVITYDVTTGVEETLLDNSDIPDRSFHPLYEGALDVSRDRRFILVTSPYAGKAYELRVADQKIVTELSNLQAWGKSSGGFAHLRTTHGIFYAQ